MSCITLSREQKVPCANVVCCWLLHSCAQASCSRSPWRPTAYLACVYSRSQLHSHRHRHTRRTPMCMHGWGLYLSVYSSKWHNSRSQLHSYCHTNWLSPSIAVPISGTSPHTVWICAIRCRRVLRLHCAFSSSQIHSRVLLWRNIKYLATRMYQFPLQMQNYFFNCGGALLLLCSASRFEHSSR